MNPWTNPVTNPDRPFGYLNVGLACKLVSRRFSIRKPSGRAVLHTVMLTMALSCVGCGESAQTAGESKPVGNESPQVQVDDTPKEVVSQFLDRVRRGGEDHDASRLLTKLAQQEMKRIGRPLQFPGSPDTRFKVNDAYPINDAKDMVWVPTILTEPTDEDAAAEDASAQDSQSVSYEVVWTVRKEIAGWRICGFTTDQGPGLDPLFINFEDGAEMEARLSQMAEEDEQIR